MTYTITRNASFNSLEIVFDRKPSTEVRDALKALKFRWHNIKKLWYGFATEEAARAAIEGKPAETVAKAAKPAAKVNKFGVKVGDLFHASWGYEQTNNDFFQVIELVGEQSVRVREVSPVCLEANGAGPMAEDRVFSTNTHGKLLPATGFSVFVKDQENGDLKRLTKSDDCVQFKISGYANAYKCTGDTIKVYESWYA